jgi:hypothetical protein
MAFDLKAALTTIAPTIATMLGGPFAGTAVATLESCFGLKPGGGEDAVTKAIQSGALTPEVAQKIREADLKHEEVMAQQGIDLVKVNNDHAQAMAAIAVDDRKDARKSNSGRDAVWWIALAILATFAGVMGAVLYGCWMLLQGGISIKDVSVVAAVSGLVGSVVGYVAANAQTVVNFIYGGSLGSEKKTDAMADAVKQAVDATARPK